ncbi:MAG: helix-turn-helix transcriptional regulator [Anaerolineales bacterium]|nr:helix-turn-helix transcriptional regulator [Anaerolineales bacterium]
MIVEIDGRPSDSPFVESIYWARSVGGGSFTSIAASQWEMVITKQKGKVTLSLRGPETKASPASIPEDAEFLGIAFRHGLFMPALPVYELVNKEIHITATGKNTFELFGDKWEFPTSENAEVFINRLLRKDMLAHDQLVDDVMRGKPQDMSLRSIQRRFLHVTGLPYKTIQQIERARQALSLLQNGAPIPDTAYLLGYFDQSHFTRSLKLYAGQTPSQIIQTSGPNDAVFLQDEASS